MTVYDLTSFAADHPGGIDILVECAGTDASEPYDYAGHGDDATEAMRKFKVGTLEGAHGHLSSQSRDKTGAGNSNGSAAPANSTSSSKSSSSWASGSGIGSQLMPMLAFVGVLALVGISVRNAIGGERRERRLPGESTGVAGPLFGFVDSFIGGLLAASTFGSVGLGWAYLRFKETLKHEKEVFAYPAVIPRRKR